MMKSGVISIAALLISLVVYSTWFFNEDLFSKSVLIIAVALPIIGIITALISKKRSFKIVGLFGNTLVLFWAVVIPFVSTLFWHTP
ncbi:hypothetical protein [Cytobacillus sp.]|uniref:hypothetical protein n=1 Tax=Cytobacillus sp. TaxID=2675269 RepID=UPI003512C2D8